MEVKLGKKAVEIPDDPAERRKELDRLAAMYEEADEDDMALHDALATQVAIDEANPEKEEGGN